MLCLHCNPDLCDRMLECSLISMAAVQSEDVRVSYLFVGDLNNEHQEWSGSVTTNRHGVAAFDFATVCPLHLCVWLRLVNCLPDPCMTDVPDLVWVADVASIRNSDHYSLSVGISMPQDVPNLCVSWKVFLKHEVN